jgi:Family of unknown function (DUF6263)
VGKLIAGKSLEMTVNEKNEVLEVSGLEELAEELGPLKQMFSKESLSQMMQMTDMQAPDREVKPGEMWPLEMSMGIPSVGRMSMRGDVTYEKNTEVDGAACAFLEYGGLLKLAAEEKKEDSQKKEGSGEEEDPALKMVEQMDMKMNGNFEGTISFDTALGMERRMTMSMTLNITMKNPADPEARMSIPMKQRFTQTLKSVK